MWGSYIDQIHINKQRIENTRGKGERGTGSHNLIGTKFYAGDESILGIDIVTVVNISWIMWLQIFKMNIIMIHIFQYNEKKW